MDGEEKDETREEARAVKQREEESSVLLASARLS